MTNISDRPIKSLNDRIAEIDDRIDSLECAYINRRELRDGVLPLHQKEVGELKAERIGLRNHIVFRLVGDEEVKELAEGEASK